MKLREDKSRLRRKYLDLVNKAVNENGRPSRLKDTKEGCENHHIQSVKMGGANHPFNLVRFTYRQHYVAHLLLSALLDTPFNLRASSSRAYQAKQETANQTRLATLADKWGDRIQETVKELSGADLARSETLKAKPDRECPHCHRSGRGGFLRFHFDHCPQRLS